MRGVHRRRASRRPDRLRAAGRRPPGPRAGGLPGAAQLVPPPQARDQPDAGPRPRRPGAALPAHLQAGLGPARRRRRGRRVAAARRRPARSRRSSACAIDGRRPAAHRLAAAVGRLGRRALPGLRRRRRTTPAIADAIVQAGARDPGRGVLHARAGPRALRRLHRPPDRGRRCANPTAAAGRRTPSPGADAADPCPLGDASRVQDRPVTYLRLRLRRGQQGPEGPARRQGRQPRRDDQPRAAGAARASRSPPRPAAPTSSDGQRARRPRRRGRRAPRRARGGDGPPPRRPRRPAAGRRCAPARSSRCPG